MSKPARPGRAPLLPWQSSARKRGDLQRRGAASRRTHAHRRPSPSGNSIANTVYSLETLVALTSSTDALGACGLGAPPANGVQSARSDSRGGQRPPFGPCQPASPESCADHHAAFDHEGKAPRIEWNGARHLSLLFGRVCIVWPQRRLLQTRKSSHAWARSALTFSRLNRASDRLFCGRVVAVHAGHGAARGMTARARRCPAAAASPDRLDGASSRNGGFRPAQPRAGSAAPKPVISPFGSLAEATVSRRGVPGVNAVLVPASVQGAIRTAPARPGRRRSKEPALPRT